MRVGHGEIQHEVDVVGCKQGFDVDDAQPVLGCPLGSEVGVEIGAGQHFDTGEQCGIAHVGHGDVAAA